MKRALLFPLALISGCCTEMGCIDGLTIELVKATAWEDGEWTVHVAADESDHACTFTVPMSREGADAGAHCDGTVDLGLEEEARVVVVRIDGAPADVVEVVVLRDGHEVASGTLRPTYEEYWPNGRRCGTSCVGALEELPVP